MEGEHNTRRPVGSRFTLMPVRARVRPQTSWLPGRQRRPVQTSAYKILSSLFPLQPNATSLKFPLLITTGVRHICGKPLLE